MLFGGVANGNILPELKEDDNPLFASRFQTRVKTLDCGRAQHDETSRRFVGDTKVLILDHVLRNAEHDSMIEELNIGQRRGDRVSAEPWRPCQGIQIECRRR